ncbi:hypothetical protein TDMWS_00160 [Thermodesulfomicrobium sp. WS]|nr:hypothetical protein TDMWS_00160 [Thermodesulfomicrobium sp. WS]
MQQASVVLRAVRRMCSWCRGGRVQALGCGECPLEGVAEDEGAPRLLARVRAFCLACAGSVEDVADCPAGAVMGVHEPCALHPFRLGRAVRLRQLLFPALGGEELLDQPGKTGGAARDSGPGEVEDVACGKEAEKKEHGPELSADGGKDAQAERVFHGKPQMEWRRG